MGKELARVPKIRFPGFTGEWKQQKAGNIFLSIVDKGHPDLPVLSASQEYGMILRTETEKTILHDEKNEVTYKHVLPGQFVIHLRSFQGGFAHSSVEGITSPAYTIMDFIEKKQHNDLFWKYVFTSENFIRSLVKITYGIRDGRSISYEDFKTLDFNIPVYNEQQKIGDFFRQLDSLITLQQRKLAHWRTKKQGLLQKMFPKPGTAFPELRFPGFTEPWVERKLGDIVEFLDGQRKPLEAGEREKGVYPYYGASGIIDYVKDYLFDEELILLSEDGANIIDRNYRVCFLANGKYWVNNHAHVMKARKGYRNGFICESLERLNYTKYNTGTAQPKLNQEICHNITLPIPSYEEQTKVFNILTCLDTLIAAQQRQLEHLQQQKKALLQQMFV